MSGDGAPPGGAPPPSSSSAPPAFDRSLPPLHTYLGDVADVGGLAHCDVTAHLASRRGAFSLTLPFVFVSFGTFLFPGQTIPLTIPRANGEDDGMCAALEACMSAPPPLRGVFGFATLRGWLESEEAHPYFDGPIVGVLAEVRRFHTGDPSRPDDPMRLVARGTRRFEIPNFGAILDPNARAEDVGRELRNGPGDAHFLVDVDAEVLADEIAPRFAPSPRLGLSPVERRVRANHDPTALAAKLRASPAWALLLGGGGGKQPLASPPRDPVAFSFWAASRVPADAGCRYDVLALPLAADRLRALAALLESSRAVAEAPLACSRCGSVVARLGNLAAVSEEGATSGVYVNPHGALHDMITVSAVEPRPGATRGGRSSLAMRGEPETAHSWFPGFAWTVANCARCHAHVGWRFTRASASPSTGEEDVVNNNDEGVPTSGGGKDGVIAGLSEFFGLSRQSVRLVEAGMRDLLERTNASRAADEDGEPMAEEDHAWEERGDDATNDVM